MKSLFSLTALLTLLFSSSAHAQYEVYDDFDRPVLNSKRWIAGSVGPVGAVEYARYLAKGELRMQLYGIADRERTTGSRVRLRNRIYMHPDAVDGVSAFQVRTRVQSARVRGCLDPAADITRVRLFTDLLWFNDGRSTGVDDFEGDVFSSLELTRSDRDGLSGKALRIVGSVFRCEDSDCRQFNQLGQSLELGEISKGTIVDLSSEWDKTNGLIKWRAKSSGTTPKAADFEYLSFVPNPVQTFNTDYFATVQVRAEVADCDVEGSGSRNPFATMDASILRVRLKRQH